MCEVGQPKASYAFGCYPLEDWVLIPFNWSGTWQHVLPKMGMHNNLLYQTSTMTKNREDKEGKAKEGESTRERERDHERARETERERERERYIYIYAVGSITGLHFPFIGPIAGPHFALFLHKNSSFCKENEIF